MTSGRRNAALEIQLYCIHLRRYTPRPYGDRFKLSNFSPQTLANFVSENDLNIGRIYPSLAHVKEVSTLIAIEVAKLAYEEGL